MKKMVVLAIVAVILTTAAYAIVCSNDCSNCQTPCVKQAQAMAACGEKPKCGDDKPRCEDPNSKPEAKCGGEKPKCDPNSTPAPTCGGADPNKPKCGK
jgi:hypothetical protein